VERLYWATTAEEVMRNDPGHYVALVILRVSAAEKAPGAGPRSPGSSCSSPRARCCSDKSTASSPRKVRTCPHVHPVLFIQSEKREEERLRGAGAPGGAGTGDRRCRASPRPRARAAASPNPPPAELMLLTGLCHRVGVIFFSLLLFGSCLFVSSIIKVLEP
jgi:hypothetical protein